MQLRHLDALRQTGSVSKYLEKFEELSHSILLYNTAYDGTYFFTRFLGRLKEEIRAAIALYKPKDVLAASSLALLQEEESAASQGKAVARDFHKSNYKPSFVPDKNKIGGSEKAAPSKSKADKGDSDEKFKSLMAFRKKNGLYYKGGEKMGPQP